MKAIEKVWVVEIRYHLDPVWRPEYVYDDKAAADDFLDHEKADFDELRIREYVPAERHHQMTEALKKAREALKGAEWKGDGHCECPCCHEPKWNPYKHADDCMLDIALALIDKVLEEK